MKFKYWLPAIAIAAAIFTVSSLPKPPQPDLGVDFSDKILHFVAYLVLAATLSFGINSGIKETPSTKKLLIAALIASLYGASDEFHQSFVPNRDADIFDWFADTFGSIVGVISFRYFITTKNSPVKNKK